MATVKAKIVDYTSKEPLAGATVRLSDAKGTYLGQGITADNKGEFEFTSPQLASNWLAVTHVAHRPMLIYANLLIGKVGNVIELARQAETLPPVVVTPKPKKSNALWWILGITAGYFILKPK